MAVHPVRTGRRQGKVIAVALPGWQKRLWEVRDAILAVGRNQAMPVDQSRCLEPVLQAPPERLARFRDEAMSAVRLQDPDHGFGPAGALPYTGTGPGECSPR